MLLVEIATINKLEVRCNFGQDGKRINKKQDGGDEDYGVKDSAGAAGPEGRNSYGYPYVACLTNLSLT